MKEKKLLFICITLGILWFPAEFAWSQCEPGTQFTELDANNVIAGFRNDGSFWWDGSDHRYMAPTTHEPDKQRHSMFAGSLWMAGIDPEGNLRGAGQTYANGIDYDFYPGPLNPANGTISADDCADWDRMFTILRTEVNAHIDDWEDNGVIDNEPANNVLGWPAVGNPNFESVHGFPLPASADNLAEFIDRNANGLYEPLQGDYPLMRGNKTLWWVFNDAGNLHFSTQADPLHMEIQVTAWARASSSPAIDNTTFYELEFHYRGDAALDSFYLGLWSDMEIGCGLDDYVGCDPDENLAYVYNGDNFDATCNFGKGYEDQIPALGIKFLKTNFNYQSGIAPGLSHFSLMAQNFPVPAIEQNESTIAAMHNMMQGFWVNGIPISQGGIGYDSSQIAPYPYLFDESLVDGEPWSMCSAEVPPSDFRTISSFGPIDLQPGMVQELAFAVVWTPNMDYPCPDLDILKATADSAQQFFEGDLLVHTPQTPEAAGGKLQLSPNPARDRARLEVTEGEAAITDLRVHRTDGRLLRRMQWNAAHSVEINTTDWAPGLYLLEIGMNDGRKVVKKLVVQR